MEKIEKYNTIYGKLNQQAKLQEYIGGKTNTATVNVNGNVITVDAKINVESIESKYAEILSRANDVENYFKSIIIEISKYDSKFYDLETKIKANSAAIKLQDTEIDKLSKENKNIIAQLAQIKIDVQKIIDTRLVAIEKEIRDAKAELELEISENKIILDNKITAVDDKVDDLENRLSDIIEESLKVLKAQLAAVQTDLTVTKKDLNDKIKANSENITKNSGSIKLINNSLLEVYDDISVLKDKIDNISTTILPLIEAKIKELSDQVDIKLSKIESQLENKLDTSIYNKDIALLEYKLNSKGGGMYYDSDGELDPSHQGKQYWYMVSDKDNPTTTVVAGPYNFGTGGGGGGGGTVTTEVHIDAVNWPSTISIGTECKLQIVWSSMREGTPTGNGRIAIYVDDALVYTQKNVVQGFATFDLTEYIKEGTHSIEVRVTDAYSNMNKVIQEITAVDVRLESKFNPDRVLSGTFNYIYTPFGADINKTTHFILDDIEIGTQATKLSGEQQTFAISNLTHGAHTLEVYFDAVIGGNQVKSNKLFYDLMYEVSGNTNPIITSTFNKLVQEQYVAFSIPYRVYSPGHAQSNIKLEINGKIEASLLVNQDTQYWESRPAEAGNFTYKIICGDIVKEFNIEVKESEIKVQAVEQDLSLYLTSTGRSNAEEHPEIWEDKKRGIACTLSNFNFVSDGWLIDSDGNTALKVTGNARVEIPLKVFEKDFKNYGKTIELEFATSDVRNYEAIIMSCLNDNRGFVVTPQIARIKSQQSELFTQYKEEEHVRITFVVEKNVETHLILMYINGIMSGAVQYPLNDSFIQSDPVTITIGSNDATTNIYNIRIYDNNLNRKQVVNNWIADTQSGRLKTERYLHNDNYNDSGELVISKLPGDLPHIIWDIDPLPQFKGDKRKGQAYYVDPVNPKKSFSLPVKEGVGQGDYNVQGTSSSVYPVKNIRLKSKEGFIDNDLNVNKLFYITDDGIGANYFTFKVDYASSEGANNVELVRLYNDAAKSIGILNPAQKLDNKVRVGIDGFPIIAFHRDATGKDSFCTKANFNNDKANEAVYGFVDGDESWEITNNSADEGNFKKPATPETFGNAFEIRFPDEDGYSDLSKLGPMTEWVVSTDPEQATNDLLPEPIQYEYETVIRSEDGTYSTRKVISPVFTNDTRDYRQTKFKAELKDWFDIDSTVFYYIFTHLYLMVDSRAKNAFPTYFVSRIEGDGGNRWFWLPYDMDTAIGINNEGKLVFDYNLEDTDKFEGANVFNGQDSVLWNNLRKMFDGEIGQMYSDLRKSGGLISYEETENRFEKHQTKWSETIFNEDSYQKYIVPLIEKGDNYLEMLQGSKAQQRKWWLYNRFKYFDSKYLAGEAKSDIFQFRAYGKADVVLTPYADIYATVSYANAAGAVVSVRAQRGKSYVIPNPLPASASDQETYIYSASQLKSVGDLSPFKPDTVKAANAVRLQELKIGDDSIVEADPAVAYKTTDAEVQPDTHYFTRSEEAKYIPGYLVDIEGYKYTLVENPVSYEINKYYNISNYGSDAGLYNNPNLRELTLGKNILLKTLNVMNCTNLSIPVDISGCTNIEEVYFDNTKITGLQLPVGGILHTLHLPDTLTNLTIRNQTSLSDLQIAGTENVTTLWLENIPSQVIDAKAFISQMKPNSEVRLIGFNQEVSDVAEIFDLYALFDTMRGINAQGEIVDKAQVNGTIRINTITYADWKTLTDKYPDITIIADAVICKVRFWNERILGQPVELYDSQNVNKGLNAEMPIPDPTRESTDEFWFEFAGWDKSLENIPSDLDIYSTYINHTREYIFNFDLQSTIPEPIPSQTILYNEKATRPVDPVIEGAIFNGWFNEPNCISLYDFESPVLGPKTVYAGWTDITKPNIYINRQSATKFSYEIRDNVALVAYGFSNSAEEEPTWIEVSPVSVLTGELEISQAGDYYVWGKDSAGFIDNNFITAFEIRETLDLGVSIKIMDGNEVILGTNILQGSTIIIEAILDDHYENLKWFINAVEQAEVIKELYVDSAIDIKAICNPKTYTVKFDMNGLGIQIEDQLIVYNHLVKQPSNQFDEGSRKVIDGWYLDNGSFQNRWDFNSNLVDQDLILYASWVPYTEPTTVTINVELEVDPETGLEIPLKVISYAWQSQNYSVAINWGDGKPEDTYPGIGYIIGEHNYTASGTYVIKYTCNKGKYKIGGDSAGRSVIVPASLITDVFFAWNMASTCMYAFHNAVNLTSVKISPYMSELSAAMFLGCTGLTSVEIPRNIISIGDSVFQNCYNLTGEIIIPDTVERLGNSIFANCSSITAISLPDNISTIGSAAFEGCSGLTNFKFPANLTRLENRLFASCLGLENLDIPEHITYLGANVFNGCSELTKLIFRASDIDIYEHGEAPVNILVGCTKLTSIGNINSGSSVELDCADLPARLFENCSSLISVNFTHSLVRINRQAFSGCSKLSSVNLPDTFKYFGLGAFENCSNLVDLEMPHGLEYIGEYAFSNTRLTQIKFYNNLTYISAYAFQDCDDLRKVILPSSIITLDQLVFDRCKSLSRVDLYPLTSSFKVEAPNVSWFYECAINCELHIVDNGEDPTLRYGAFWNYRDQNTKLDVLPDLEVE